MLEALPLSQEQLPTQLDDGEQNGFDLDDSIGWIPTGPALIMGIAEAHEAYGGVHYDTYQHELDKPAGL